MKRVRETAGFTLVELIVVIAILGILGGVAVPAYSGYVKKAETAADQALLSSVNMAFATACLQEGYSQYELNAGGVRATIDANGNLTEVTVSEIDAFNSKFQSFFAGGGAFKNIKGLAYMKELGQLVEGNNVNGYVFTGADQSAVQNSTWGGLSADTIMDMVGDTTNSVEATWGNTYYKDMLADAGFRSAAAEVLGVANYEQYLESQVEATAKAQYEATNGAGSWDSLNNGQKAIQKNAVRTAVQSSVNANTAVLVAAQKASGQADSVMALIRNSTGSAAKDTIKATLDTDSTAGLAQAAIAYGMYKSYIYSNDDIAAGDKESMSSPLVALNDLDNAGFKAYLETQQGKDDLAGLMAAMNVINGQDTGMKETTASGGAIAENGDLREALEALLGN